VLNRGYVFKTLAADSHIAANLKNCDPDTDRTVSFARRSGIFSFLSSTGTLMGMIFAVQKVNQLRLQCRFSLFSFDYKKERGTL